MLDNNPSLRDLNKVFCWLQDVKRTVRNFVRHHLVSDEATQTAFDALMADESLSPQQKPWVKIKVLVEAGAGEDNSVMMVIDGMLEGIKEIEENAQMQVSEGVVLGV